MSEVIDENYEIIDADSWELKRDMIDRFQELSGRKLTESSPETLIFETVAYMIGLREEKYNDEMKQNYLRFARDERLDLKGEFYGNRGKRLVEQPAVATFRFYITGVQATDIIIPKGSRIQYNELYFSTDEQYKIEKGDLYVDGIATCNTSGTVGNDIPVGQINTMVDIFPHYDKVENITASNNGAEIEQDDNYRARIREIPESFTTAGSKGAYEFWAKSTSTNIVDVVAYSPSATNVDIYVLTDSLTLTNELKKRIEEMLNTDNIRPLTDNVTIKQAIKTSYTIDFDYYIDKSNETLVNVIKNNVEKAVKDFKTWQQNKMGRDINPDELIKLLKLAGVKRVVLRSPTFQVLNFNEIAENTSVTSNYLGVENI